MQRQGQRAATAWSGGDDARCSERDELALALRSSCSLVGVHTATSPPSGRQGEAQQAPCTARHALCDVHASSLRVAFVRHAQHACSASHRMLHAIQEEHHRRHSNAEGDRIGCAPPPSSPPPASPPPSPPMPSPPPPPIPPDDEVPARLVTGGAGASGHWPSTLSSATLSSATLDAGAASRGGGGEGGVSAAPRRRRLFSAEPALWAAGKRPTANTEMDGRRQQCGGDERSSDPSDDPMPPLRDSDLDASPPTQALTGALSY